MTDRGMVWRIEGKRYVVRSPDGTFACAIAGKLKKGKGASGRPVAVGDDVEFDPGTGGEGRIGRVMPRRTFLAREDVQNSRVPQVLIANMEQVVVVQAVAWPALDWHVVDRGLIMASSGGMTALICLNKIDLQTADSVAAASLAQGVARYRKLGYAVVLTSTIGAQGLEDLASRLKGRSSVMLGPSGVGKSSLLNALAPELHLQTGELSAKSEMGRHTTTWFELIAFPGGGVIGDTPGIEMFTPWGMTRESVARHFPEFETPAAGCKFNDCRHDQEPACRVKEAVDTDVTPERYESYLKILASVS